MHAITLASRVASGLLAAALLVPTAVVGAERVVHVSPTGRGDGSGARVEDAMSFDRAAAMASRSGERLTLRLAAGVYDVGQIGPVRLVGQNGGPLVIEGAGEDTVLAGLYAPSVEKSGPALFRLERGGVTFRRFAVRNVPALIDVGAGASVDHVVVEGVSVTDVHDGILLDRSRARSAHDWRIEKVSIAGYVRAGIRLAGPGASGFVIRDTKIDGRSGRGADHCFKGGIQLYAAVSDVLVEDVVVRDNVACTGQHYQQGDGIEADDKQGMPDRVTLRRVTSIDNRDGNYDLKAGNVVLEDVASQTKGGTRFGFRFWNYDYVCRHCRIDAATGSLQFSNAQVTFEDAKTDGTVPVLSCHDRVRWRPSVVRMREAGREVFQKTCPTKTP